MFQIGDRLHPLDYSPDKIYSVIALFWLEELHEWSYQLEDESWQRETKVVSAEDWQQAWNQHMP